MKTGVSYYGNRLVKHFKRDLQDMIEHHCNFVLHTFSEEDWRFYESTVGDMVRLTREAGLEACVDPWAVGSVFGGEEFSDLVATDLDVRQVGSGGTSLPHACLNNSKFRQFMRRWLDTVAAMEADSVLWDEPHFHLPQWGGSKEWGCRCETCQGRFKEKFGAEMPLEECPEVRDFKEDSVLDFLIEMCDYTHTKGMKNVVCLLPAENQDYGMRDWSKIVSIPSLDVFGTDPYWRKDEKDVGAYVGRFAKRVVELTAQYGKEAQIWILNFGLPAGTESNVRLAVEAAYEAGVRNLGAWCYEGAAHVSTLKSGNPQAVWETLGRSYEWAHSKARN
ncbi:MAG: hypothetical protein JW937_10660 [Candidatus Omnitrophica bacterium]|nr:hypothetical protein [Candidatus Omnitrophota bacterium]